MFPPINDWWDCLHPIERGCMVGLAIVLDPITLSTPCIIADPIIEISIPDPARREAFRTAYGVVSVGGLPFPPPFDCLTSCANEPWREIWNRINFEGSGFDQCKCAVLKAPGNQGGAWDPCWP